MSNETPESFWVGYNAAVSNKDMNSNPYTRGTEDHVKFNEGFTSALHELGSRSYDTKREINRKMRDD